MKIEIDYSTRFRKDVKHLAKKYRSLADDLVLFEQELIANPNAGTLLTEKVRKVRMQIKSKAQGKSGGARVITYDVLLAVEHKKVVLLKIYDKSEIDSVSIAEIKELITEL